MRSGTILWSDGGTSEIMAPTAKELLSLCSRMGGASIRIPREDRPEIVDRYLLLCTPEAGPGGWVSL